MSAQCVVEQLVKNSGITLHNSTELYPALHRPGDQGLPMLVVDNALCRAVIALHGAHLMAFTATGQREMLWISPKTALEAGTPPAGSESAEPATDATPADAEAAPAASAVHGQASADDPATAAGAASAASAAAR